MHTMEKRFRHERFASGKGGRGDREGKRGGGWVVEGCKTPVEPNRESKLHTAGFI